jgi:hypothetical protein
MTRVLIGLGAAAVAALVGLGAPTASAAPLPNGVRAPVVNAEFTQYVERRTIRRGPGGRIVERRVIRPRREVCRVDVVRRFTPRGVVVERVRRCR